MFKKSIFQVSALCIAALLSAAALAGCSKSSSDDSSKDASYSGDKLMILHNGVIELFRSEGAEVSVKSVDETSIVVLLSNIVNGFESVVASGSYSSSDGIFSVQGKASDLETVIVYGTIIDGVMSLDYSVEVKSQLVKKWMMGEKAGAAAVLPDVEMTFTSLPSSSSYTPEELSERGTELLEICWINQSRYFDDVEFMESGQCGVNWQEYHAVPEAVSKQEVDAVWSREIADGYTAGDFVGTGGSGQVLYYMENAERMGLTFSNSLVGIINSLLQQYEFQLPVPFTIPFYYSVNGDKAEFWLDQDIMKSLLLINLDYIKLILDGITYESFIAIFPEGWRESVKQILPEKDFPMAVEFAREFCSIALDDASRYKVKCTFIEYYKTLRPWEE